MHTIAQMSLRRNSEHLKHTLDRYSQPCKFSVLHDLMQAASDDGLREPVLLKVHLHLTADCGTAVCMSTLQYYAVLLNGPLQQTPDVAQPVEVKAAVLLERHLSLQQGDQC